MSGDEPRGTDDWSAVPARDPGHLADPSDGLEARRTPATSGAGTPDGRVHGRPAPGYGEYAPEGWVNPVLVEQERREQEERSRALREQAAREAPRDHRAGAPSGATGVGRAAPAAGRFGASPLDFVLTVGLLVIGLWSVIESLSVGTTASTIRTVVEQQYTDLSDPAALSSAVLVRAVVLVVVFVLVVWWSIRRLRARRWTFWVPLVGGVVATVLGMVPVMVVIFQDPQFAAYLQRMAGG
ncbi:hypothetical protein GCM10017714_17600 [Curtobacterium pusillum]|uniref:Uncharacterized protein n=1 Tax=Curtobacterium pusillum TaxID=69373 RepID=A0ABX2MAA6_9MICO|nr:DUF6264 family protein [Curtobacterium pusillum]NUU14398.1 hypothetical protein [Curtobacterium pusillum]GLK31020.1 hypothetical protein GCM10017610_13050 [Curtobacterium pusillum]